MKSQLLSTLFHFLLLLCLCALHLSPRAQQFIYAKTLNNPDPWGSSVVGRSIKSDNAGNTYVTGEFRGTADFDPGAGTANLTSNPQTSDNIFIARYDASGNYVYAKGIAGSAGECKSNDIAVDGSGNIYITGYFSGTGDFDPGPGVANLTSLGDKDIFVARYDASGNYVYAIAIGGTSEDNSNGIAVDGAGNVYITGYFFNTADFDPRAGVANLTSHGSRDIFIARYDASGNLIFATGVGGDSFDMGKSIILDGMGNVYITGHFSGTVDFDPGAGVDTLTGGGGNNIFFARYETSGKYVYAKAILGDANIESNSIAADGAGNAYITGYFFWGTVDFDPGTGEANLVNPGGPGIFIAGYDASGNYLYAKAITVTGFGQVGGVGNSIAADSSANIYITGYFEGTADFDPGTGVANLTSGLFNKDIFVAKYDGSGNYVYAKAMGGSRYDYGNDITIDPSGNVYITGSFAGTADFDPGPGVANLTIGGNAGNDFVSHLDNAGNYAWSGQLGKYTDSVMNNHSADITNDALGNTYITGNFQGTVDFDPGPGVANLTSLSYNNIFVAKYDPSGNYLFAFTIIGGSSSGIALDGQGNIYITGGFAGTVDFDPGTGEANLTSRLFGPNFYSADIFIAKYDPSGKYLFAKRIGGSYDDGASEIVVDGQGNIYITGWLRFPSAIDHFGINDIFVGKYDASGNAVYESYKPLCGYDFGNSIAVDGLGNAYITGLSRYSQYCFSTFTSIYIARYDASGNIVYEIAIGNPGSGGNSIAVDGSGSIYVTGFFSGTVDFDPGPGEANLSSAGEDSSDIFVAKYDPSGKNVFAKRIGSTGSDGANSIAVDGSGNIYITGSFSGTVDFDPGTSVANLASSSGNNFISRYDNSGNYAFAKSINVEVITGISLDGLSNLYITGSFSFNADLDPGGGSANPIITAPSNRNIYFAKYAVPSAALPVNLESFSAQPIGDGAAVKINWSTASQKNNAYFEVEHSKDGVTFETIGRINGCSTCNQLQRFEFIDHNPYSGLSYYRLRIVAHDNDFSYSKVATVHIIKNPVTGIHAYPNINNGAFEIRISNIQDKKQVIVQIFNAVGNMIKQETAWLNEGDNRLRYNLSGKAAGVYYIKITDIKSSKAITTKVIKQ